MSCEGCTKEKQAVGKGAETVALLNEAVKQRDGVIKLLAVVLVGVVLAFMVTAGCMVWAVQNAQNVANEAAAEAIASAQETMNEAVLSALKAVSDMEVTTTETTTTQTVEGDSATINNVDGEQYNDNASKGGVE